MIFYLLYLPPVNIFGHQPKGILIRFGSAPQNKIHIQSVAKSTEIGVDFSVGNIFCGSATCEVSSQCFPFSRGPQAPLLQLQGRRRLNLDLKLLSSWRNKDCLHLLYRVFSQKQSQQVHI